MYVCMYVCMYVLWLHNIGISFLSRWCANFHIKSKYSHLLVTIKAFKQNLKLYTL